MIIQVPTHILFQCESRLKLSKTVTNAMCERDCASQALAFFSKRKVPASVKNVAARLQTFLALAKIPSSGLVYHVGAKGKTVCLNILGFKQWSHDLPASSDSATQKIFEDALAQEALLYLAGPRSSRAIQPPLPSLLSSPTPSAVSAAASVVSHVPAHSALDSYPTMSSPSVVVTQLLSWPQEVQRLTADIEHLPILDTSKAQKSRTAFEFLLRDRVLIPWLQAQQVDNDVSNYERLVGLINRLVTSQVLSLLSSSLLALLLMIALRAPTAVDVVNAQRWLRAYGSTAMWDSHYPTHALWAVLHQAMRLTMAKPLAPEAQAHCDAFVLMLAGPIIERWQWGNQRCVPLALWCGLSECVETIGFRLGVSGNGAEDKQTTSPASQSYSRKMSMLLSTDLERHWSQVQALYSLHALPLDSVLPTEAPPASSATFALQMSQARANVTQTFQHMCNLNAQVSDQDTETLVTPQLSMSFSQPWPVSAPDTIASPAYFLSHASTPSISVSMSNFFVGLSVGQSLQSMNAFDSEHNATPISWSTLTSVSPIDSPALACLARVTGISVQTLTSTVLDVQTAAREKPDDVDGAYGSLWFGLLLAQARDYPSLTRPCANITTLLHNPQWQALLAGIALPTSAVDKSVPPWLSSVVIHHSNVPFSASCVDATLSMTLRWLGQMHHTLPSADSVSELPQSASEVLFLLLFMRTFAVWHRLWSVPMQPSQQQLVAQVGFGKLPKNACCLFHYYY
jgi:hypothetical protein